MAEEDFEDLLRRKTSDKILCVKLLVALWCSGYHYCTTSFNKAWILLQHRLKTSVSDICNYVNLWQWSWMEIRLNIFCQSTILQKHSSQSIFNLGLLVIHWIMDISMVLYQWSTISLIKKLETLLLTEGLELFLRIKN